MVFSSVTFLFVFLPVVLALYYCAASHIRNSILLGASLVFYAWGEPAYVFLMMASIIFNWFIGALMGAYPGRPWQRAFLALGVIVNLLLLGYFKYFAFFANSLLDAVGSGGGRIEDVSLPIGISFFTFHAISYLVDIYRSQAKALKNPVTMGLYISLFPQLVAGPIIRFHDIADQLVKRATSLEKFASGIERFTFGLGKKVLLANPLGAFADACFAVPANELSAPIAWLGILCYTLQIYFDFSGYSDMAIGLGRMFGFEFPENFNYPYIATSIREFWRRWHLSLSAWFRDYVYIPLGGNRTTPLRARLNLCLVFLLCGLWHGASWNFVVWGMFHGALLAVERGAVGRGLARLPTIAAWCYTMLLVMIGWVFFRADNLAHAFDYLQAMAGVSGPHGYGGTTAALLNAKLFAVLAIGLLLMTPVATFFARDWRRRRFPGHANEAYGSWIGERLDRNGAAIWLLRMLAVFGVLSVSIAEMATSTYNPFIYFRF